MVHYVRLELGEGDSLVEGEIAKLEAFELGHS